MKINISNQKIILNQNLVIQCPSDLIRDEIIKSNTFPNPVYQQAIKYGRYAKHLPQEIETYTIEGSNLIVKRGYYRELSRLLNDNEIDFETEDERTCPYTHYPKLMGVCLRPYQKRVVDMASKHSQGVIVSPTGSGKTIMALELIRTKQTPALIIVHKQELADQWAREIKKLFGFTPAFIGDGKFEIGSQITIGMVQTISKREEQCKEICSKWGLVFCEEAHHFPAETFSKVLGWMPCKYRYGLSATPTRRDGLDCLIFRAIGPVIAEVSRSEVQNVGSVIPAVVDVINTNFDPGIVNNWHEFLNALNSPKRNMLIIKLIPKDKSTLILVDRIAHAENISAMLCERKIDHVLAHGQLPTEERDSLMQRIRASIVTIGTTGLLGEGLDVSHWDTLILANPISSEAKLLQAIGRIVRPSQDKEVGTVLDLRDNHKLAGSSLNSRLRIYEKHGIEFN